MGRRRTPRRELALPPLIHIGYPKTGTTWLQTRVFRDGPPGCFRAHPSRRLIKEQFVTVNPFRFDAGEARSSFEAWMAATADAGRIPVLSHERLTGTIHSGAYDGMPIAERLARAFPEARVLIVIREQREMMLSAWQQYVQEGGACSIKRYLDPPHDARVPLFDFRALEYDNLIAFYQKLFGRSGVLVLPFELLRDDSRTFLESLARFSAATGAHFPDSSPVNRSLSGFAVSLLRLLNYAFGRDSLNPSAPFSGHGRAARALRRLERLAPKRLAEWPNRRTREYVWRVTDGVFGESNRRIEILTGLSLGQYGYLGGAESGRQRDD